MAIKPGQSKKGFIEAKKWNSRLLEDMHFGLNIYNTQKTDNSRNSQSFTAVPILQSHIPSTNALFEIQLQLDDCKIVFIPSLEHTNNENNFHNIFSTLIKNILETNSHIPRIIHKSLISEYRKYLNNMEEIDALNKELMQQEKEGKLRFLQIMVN